MGRIRVLIVDDSAVYRRLVSDALTADPEVEVVGAAANGRLALAKLTQINPDVVTLDVEMPEMDGLATLTELRKTHPNLPVIMFSSRTEPAAEATVEALLKGATDYATKPSGGDGAATVRAELLPKIKASCRTIITRAATSTAPAHVVAHPGKIILHEMSTPTAPGIVAIGVSTGGPNALSQVFRSLPAGLSVPLVIVQHMPPMFTRILAERLAADSGMKVREASEGDIVTSGLALVAPGGMHMTIVREGGHVVVRLNNDPPENSCRPAVDVLFRSVSNAFGREALAIVMTGMGQDGYRGSQTIVEAGGHVWAQDEATSVVWGMPGFVARSGIAEKVLPLQEIGPEVVRRIGKRREAVVAAWGSR